MPCLGVRPAPTRAPAFSGNVPRRAVGLMRHLGHMTWHLGPQPMTHTRTAGVLPQDIADGNCQFLPGGRRHKTCVRSLCCGLVPRLSLPEQTEHAEASSSQFLLLQPSLTPHLPLRLVSGFPSAVPDDLQLSSRLAAQSSWRWISVSRVLGNQGVSDLDCRIMDQTELRRALCLPLHPSHAPTHRTEGVARLEEVALSAGSWEAAFRLLGSQLADGVAQGDQV